MISFSTLLASFAIGGSFAATIPLSPEASGPGKTFSLKVFNNPGAKINRARQLTFDEKPGTSLGQDLGHLEKRALKGSVAAQSNDDESSYFVEVDIGSPPQKMRLMLDTGSSDVWVASSLMPQSMRPKEPVYEISAEDISLKDSTFDTPYIDEVVAVGDVYLETVSIGGLKVENQAVGMAKSVKGKNALDGYSGMLGMGMDKLNSIKPQKQPTWFSNIKSQLEEPIFTANIKRGATGTCNFGYIDKSEYTGKIIYAPHLDDQGHWDIDIDGFSMDDGDAVASAVRRATIDTGTSYMYVADKELVRQYYESFGARWNKQEEAWHFACQTRVPDFSFWIGKEKVTIPGSLVNLGEVYDDDDSVCYGGIEGTTDKEHLIGLVALQALFVVFDASAAKRIGFASKPI